MSVRFRCQDAAVSSRDPYPRNPQLADGVMKRLAPTLRGREHDGVRVAAVVHYGAVSIDAKHLVVWLLLEGRPDDQIPEWLTLTPTLVESLRPPHVDYDWLLALRSEVMEAFQDAGWPDPDGPSFCVDSEHRVSTGGGWNYFR